MLVQHLTSSKRLIELPNKLGSNKLPKMRCMHAVNTSVAEEVLAKVSDWDCNTNKHRADMQQPEITYPDVYSEFAAENHFIKAVQGSPLHKFLLKWPIDQRRLKVKFQRWFLTIHEQASITSPLKVMYGLQAAPRRVERDEEDVKKMKDCWLNDRYVYSRLGYAYHYHHRSSSATLNLEPSSVLRAIPNIFPVSFFSTFH